MDENIKNADGIPEKNESPSADKTKKWCKGIFKKSQKKENSADEKALESTGGKKVSTWKSFLGLFEHTWFIILLFVLAVLLVSAVIIGIVMKTNGYTLGEIFGIKIKRVDYLNDDLSEYLQISDEDYKNLEIDVNIRRPSSVDVADKVVGALASAAKDLESDSPQYNVPVSAGDKIYFHYTAYIKDEMGNRVKEIADMNNFKDSDRKNPELATFVVGSGNFSFLYKGDANNSSVLPSGYELPYIHGFESGLASGNAYPTDVVFFHQGEILENDIVYATATYIDSLGIIHDRENIRIDLSDESCESVWGVGVYDYIVEKDIGELNNSPYTLNLAGSGKKITFTDFTVDYITRGGETPVTLETVFPYDYEDESLRNKTVYFDLFIDRIVCYKTPEFNDKFVTETLKLTEQKLSKYSGQSLTEKCEAYYLEMLVEEYNENRRLLAEELVWEQLVENIEIEMPIREVDYDYEEYLSLYNWMYQMANDSGQGYESLDEYMTTQLGLELGSDWNTYVWNSLDEDVRRKLIFYSIAKNEGLTEAEYEEFCDFEMKRSYKSEVGKSAEDFESAEKYEEAIAEYRQEKVDICGGEDEFKHEMYFRYASEIIINNAKITDIVN